MKKRRRGVSGGGEGRGKRKGVAMKKWIEEEWEKEEIVLEG